jgi:ribose 5-phosphate isomerase B
MTQSIYLAKFFSMPRLKIWVGCDHAGYPLKKQLMEKFTDVEWHDQGTFSEESVDYPDYAAKVAEAMQGDEKAKGLLICGSAQGVAMKANRYAWIRAAVCWSEEVAKLSRQHNDANVCCLAARLLDALTNEKIFKTFITTEFEGGRHQKRVAKLNC